MKYRCTSFFDYDYSCLFLHVNISQLSRYCNIDFKEQCDKIDSDDGRYFELRKRNILVLISCQRLCNFSSTPLRWQHFLCQNFVFSTKVQLLVTATE